MTTIKTCRTSVPEKLVQIQRNILLYKFKKIDKSMRLDNKILTNKNEADKDKVDKNKAESHIIAGLVTLVL